VIRLEAGAWAATVAPAMGGAVLSLEDAGRPIFRPTPADATEILETACFPLIPYANRIAGARFSFGRDTVDLPTLPDFAPHALHGDGWLRAWSVTDQKPDSVSMTLQGGGDHWPWAWSAIQTVRLSASGLRIDLSIVNESDRAAPAGLGFHPYFHRAPESRLTLPADGVWLTGADEIPERLAPVASLMDWSDGPAIAAAPWIDHAYATPAPGAVLDDNHGRLILSASDNCRWTQVYAPTGRDFLCLEPMTHRPDAIHAPAAEHSGQVVLRPGGALAIWMTVARPARKTSDPARS
jgi:aldose 1-epimerase